MDVDSRWKRLTNRQRAEKERMRINETGWKERNSTDLMDGSILYLLPVLDKEIRHVIYGYDENNNDNK